MVVMMRRAMIRIATVLAAAGGATGVPGAATTSAATTRSSANPTPTAAQIRRAVTHAEHSRYLWATVNVCQPGVRQGGLIGVRGEMGALWFRSTLSMTVRLRQYDSARQSFLLVKGPTATRTVTLGRLRRGVHQDGVEFHYSSETGLLDATVTFIWSRNGRRLGDVTVTTTGGHPNAAFAEPPGHSTASCRL